MNAEAKPAATPRPEPKAAPAPRRIASLLLLSDGTVSVWFPSSVLAEDAAVDLDNLEAVVPAARAAYDAWNASE